MRMAEKKNDLRELLAKINHPLLDVRSRSLRSVVFKLNTGLLYASDLMHERDFLAHLLEWFNFEEVSMEGQVLSLISQLSEYEAAAQILVEIGGVEFLSQLRLHSDPSLHPLIDKIIEQLLKLPQNAADSAGPEKEHCSSTSSSSSAISRQTSTTESSTDYGSYLKVSKQSFGLTDESTALPPEYLERASSVGTSTQSSVPGSTSSSSMEASERLRFGVVGERPQPCFPYVVSPAGMTSAAQEDRSERNPRTEPNGGSFPWLRLSQNDRHILATTDSRLQGATVDGLKKSCEFIQDVLFQDFPAELFLQRPSLVKSLLKLLEQDNVEDTHRPILLCLLELTTHLQQRMALYSDPAVGITDWLTLPAMMNEDSSTAPLPPQSHDLPPQSHDLPPKSHDLPPQSHDLPPQSHDLLPRSRDLEQLSEDMLLYMQLEQVSLEQYCHSVIATVTSLLLGYLSKHAPQLMGEVESSKSGSSCKPLSVHIAICLQLLAAVVNLLEQLRRHARTPQLSQKNSTLGVQSLESLTSVLSHCLSKWRRFGTSAQSSCPQLQLVCWITSHLAICFGKLLEAQEPHLIDHLPTATVSVLRGLMMNGVIAVACPRLQEMLQPHFDQSDADNSQLFQKIKLLSTTFEKMSLFLNCVQCSEDQPCEPVVQLATEALPGLSFHCNKEFTTASLKLCTGILMDKDKHDEWNTAIALLLKLLSHESDGVKQLAYEHLKDNILKGIADLKQHPTGTAHTANDTILPLILNQKVLEEVCCHGAVSSVEAVCTAACGILGSLVVLWEELFWPELLKSILQWMPYIEVCMSTNEHLCKQVQKLLDSKDSGLSDASRLQSHFRLLFSTKTELRVWSSTALSKLLLSDDGGKLSPFPLPASVALHDVFALGKEKPTHSVHDISGSGTFQNDDVLKLLHILRSPVMDSLLRKTALEQLTILLKDPSLHASALEEGITTDLMLVLSVALQRKEGSEEQGKEEPPSLLKPCIQCLQLLVHSSATLREELGVNCSFLLDAFRASLFLHGDVESLHSALMLLVCLLFAPVSFFPSPGGRMKLPESVLNRLRIPLLVDSYRPECGHSTPSPLEPSLLFSDPALSMLRLHYHVAMQGSVENLLKTQGVQSPTEIEKLRISNSDLLALSAVHLQSSLLDCFKSLQAASSHSGVMHHLHHFSVLMQICNSTAKGLKATTVDHDLEWNQVLERFLTVHPTTAEDVSLLTSVLQFLCDLLDVPASVGLLVGQTQLEWLARTTAGHETVCLQLLCSSLQSVEHRHSTDPYRALQKTLLRFFVTLTERLAGGQAPMASFDPLALLETLCQCLDVAGSPNYYDLPVLENSLQCLLHLTASSCMSKISTPEWMALSMKLMTSLRQVLWSFISGRGSMLASFMGKGVTSRAALSLCHLLQTFSRLSPPEGWWVWWVQSAPDVGLLWLHSLVKDREPQVRYAGMSLLASLCTLPSLVELVLEDWTTEGNPFGLWGVCLQTVLGQECSLVRQQAFFVLVSLSALCSTEKKWSQYLTYKRDEVTVCGQKALELLLKSYGFFPTLQTLVQTQSLLKLKERTPLPITKSINSCLLQEGSCNCRNDESSNKDYECLSEILQEAVRCCDPHVMTGACKLLHNLLLEFPEPLRAHILTHSTIGTLISVVDFELFGLFLLGYNSSAISLFQWSSWVQMCTDVASLLKVAMVVLQPDTTLPHLLREGVVASLCKILSLTQALEKTKEDCTCLSLCSAVVALLQVIVERAPSSKIEVVFSCLQLHWNSFTGLLHYSFLHPNTSGSALKANTLRLFCSLLVNRFQPDSNRTGVATDPASEPRVAALRHLLDGRKEQQQQQQTESGDQDETSASSSCTDSESGILHKLATTASSEGALATGSILCEALLSAYDGTVSGATQDEGAEERQLIGDSLGVLLACSTAAKQTALKAGLLESSTEMVKTLHSKLCMDSLEQAAGQNKKKKESPLMTEVISVVNLLRDFMYLSAEVKSAAVGCNLPTIVHKLWPWCTVNRRLVLAVLKLLTCLTAHHAKGQACLASSVVRGANNSLLHSVIKLAAHTITGYNSCSAAKMVNPHTEVLRAIFTLLANCALSAECRGVLKKTTFLSGFMTVNPRSEKIAHGRTRLSFLWLKLLVNLSFSTEGQQMIVKLPGSLDVVLDLHQCCDSESQSQCLLLLRNLCFFGPSKTLLASNENFLRLLCTALESVDRKQIALAASAVWALLHNCSKIKHSLKKSELAEKLGNTYFSLKADQPTSTGPDNCSTDELLCRTMVSKAQTLLH